MTRFCILCSENFAQHERDNLCCKTGLRRGEMLLLFADLIARFSLLLCFIVYEAAARMSVNLTSTSQHKPARAGSISYSTIIFLGKTTTTKRKEGEKRRKTHLLFFYCGQNCQLVFLGQKTLPDYSAVCPELSDNSSVPKKR